MAQQTQVNGCRYSFTNLSAAANGSDFARGIFKAVNYDAMQEPGIVQGNQIGIMGRTDGYGTASGNIEMLLSESDDFNAFLTNNGAFPLMGVFWDLTVSYSVNDVDVRTDQLLGLRITKVGQANQQGNDASTVTYDLSIAKMYRNGILMFGDPA